VLTENMDLDAATGDENSLDHLAEGIEGIDNVALDLRDIVDLVYKDRRLFPGLSCSASSQDYLFYKENFFSRIYF
jgi:hypothetical protein